MKTTLNANPALHRQLRLVVAVFLLGPVLATAQTRSGREPPPVRDVNPATVPLGDDRDGRVARPLKRSDRDFFEKSARAIMPQIQISRIAAARTSNPDVRRLAQSMIADHQDALDELAGLAARKGVSLPAKDPHPDKWEKRKAKNFDRDYLDKMVDDHEDIVKLFDKQARDGEDVDTVAFARKHLAKLQHHLQQSLDMKRLLK